MGHSSEVLNQSDKLLIKTGRSFYLNKYGFKTPRSPGLNLEFWGSLEFDVGMWPRKDVQHPLFHPLCPHRGASSTLWPPYGLREMCLGLCFVPWCQTLEDTYLHRPWERARGHLGKGIQDPGHLELSLEGVHF